MILDSAQEFSGGQAVTASAVSTNIIDLGVDRDIGKGEPMAIVVSSSVAAGGTNPTLQVELQTDSVEGMGSLTTIATSEQVAGMEAGQTIVVPLGMTNERYLRLRYVTTGTSPTHTLDAFLQPLSMVDAKVDYASGYSI
ncbi:MAG: Bbp16 family capsid cement protein [Marinomonas sp.]